MPCSVHTAPSEQSRRAPGSTITRPMVPMTTFSTSQEGSRPRDRSGAADPLWSSDGRSPSESPPVGPSLVARINNTRDCHIAACRQNPSGSRADP